LLAVLDLGVFDFLGDFEVEKAAQEVHPDIARPDALPEVRGLVTGRVFRVAGGSAVAEVEREEGGFGAGKAGGHVDLVGIDGEVDEGALFEGEDLFARVAISAVLPLGVLDGLGGELVLEFGSGGNAVDTEDQVERLVVLGAVVKLAGEDEAV